jgi:DNA-binding transcriptional regulator LsrR (DeoR family)
MKKLSQIPDAVLVEICRRFLKRESTMEIRDWVNKELPQVGISDYEIKREQVYQLVGLATRRGFFLLSPPEEKTLTDRLVKHFGVASNEVRVVGARHSLEPVVTSAAKLAVELIEELSKDKPELHIGLGGGWTTMLMTRKLAALLPSAKRLPTKLTIHALSTGFNVHRSYTAPVAFFSFFDDLSIEIDRVGLFASAVVDTHDYEHIKELPGVIEAFEAVPTDGLDLVITSLGSASHDHGDFSTFMERGSVPGWMTLKNKGWIGDVQYRPFSQDGPIMDDTKVRTVTLLELDDLVELASKPNKHVIVVAGPCGQCGKTRSDAVYPLLANSRLKLWTRFVMDIDTAKELLNMPASA